MDMKSKIRKINWREVAVDGLGFLVARAVLFTMNPIGVGYFVAAYGEKRNRIFLFLSVLLGMATVMTPIKMAKYIMVFLVFGVVIGILERVYERVTPAVMAVVGGSITAIFALFDMGEWTRNQSYCALAVLEGILVLAIANLFHLGIATIFRSKRKKAMENEEIISIAILLGAVVYSMPTIANGQFSFVETMAYLVVLFFGYRYGGGPGTIAGVVCGMVISVETGNPIGVGIFAILGLATGMFRELGRVATAMIFLVLTIGFGFFYEDSLIQIAGARGLASALTLFLLIPRKLIRRVQQEVCADKTSEFAQDNLKMMTKHKLSEFSEAFQSLSKTFYQMSEVKNDLNQSDIDHIFDSLSERLCSHCRKCKQCWNRDVYDKYRTSSLVLNAAKQRGMVLATDLPEGFQDTCLNFEAFLDETNRELEIASLNLDWNNRMAESREAIARQLGEVSNIMNDFAKDLLNIEEGDREIEKILERELRMCQLDVKNIAIIEKRNKKQEVFMELRTRHSGCVTTREVASLISSVLGKRMRPSFEAKNIVTRKYEHITFIEDTDYKMLTGLAKRNKDGEIVSGDNFSFMQLESGEMVMTLSDGMGAGESACEQSESLVDLLEQCMEAGFSEQSAIRLINSFLVVKPNRETFSTLDMSIVNLYTGKCNFLKMGASTTFIKRNNWVEAIQSTTLPVGLFHQMDIDNITKKLYDGDFIIMVSDGILDSIDALKPEEYIEELLSQINSNNPQEIADFILEHATQEEGYVGDDRTVMVAGFWRK